MPLTKFVNNVEDLSDDGGYKFRFKCDRCGDGFESQYIAGKANVLKPWISVVLGFLIFMFWLRACSTHGWKIF